MACRRPLLARCKTAPWLVASLSNSPSLATEKPTSTHNGLCSNLLNPVQHEMRQTAGLQSTWAAGPPVSVSVFFSAGGGVHNDPT